MDAWPKVEIADTSVMELEWARIAIAQAFRHLTPEGALGRELQRATASLYDYMHNITHRVTGRLASSQFVYLSMAQDDLYGQIGTNLSYAGAEAAREGFKTRGQGPYGGHDFLGRTVQEAGPVTLEEFAENLWRSIANEWEIGTGGDFGTGATGEGLDKLLGLGGGE